MVSNFFGRILFVKSLLNPAALPELSSWSASTAWQVLLKKTYNVNKTAAFSHHCFLWQEHCHWAFIYQVYFRIYDSGPSNPTTFLGLCYLGDYRQHIESPTVVPTFNSTEKALKFTIYYHILGLRQKKCET